jgi:hypothetical protein
MFFPLLSLSSFVLLLIDAARAQVSAPNCTDEALYTWVGSFYVGARFVLISRALFALYWFSHILVVQFPRPKSLLSCCVPGSGMQQWRLVHILLVHRV